MFEALLTPEELDKNKANRKKLLSLIYAGNAILMAGSGCSASIYPPWKTFLDILEKKALTVDPDFTGNKDDFLGFASKVKACIGQDRYDSLLYEEFKPKEKTHEIFHESLCKLPFRGLVTTNYDSVLESALNTVNGNIENWLCLDNGSKRTIFEFIRSLDEKSTSLKKVLHLHGRYNIANSIVLCEEEYLQKYGFSIKEHDRSIYDEIKSGKLTEEHFNKLLLEFGYQWPIHRKMVWSLLATRRVVFMGFSMNDPYFLRMLQFVSDDLSPYDSDIHFLVLRITTENKEETLKFAAQLKERYGIETVLFPDDGNYKGFENFIAEMANELIPTPATDQGTDARVKSKASMPGSDEITRQLFELSKKQIDNED
ncbi:MAG: SIR2 family protein [Bacteroidota bacterium]